MQSSTQLTLKLGIPQIITWGSGFYLPAILAVPISKDLGIPTETLFWAFTISLLVSGLVGPRIGKAIDRLGGRRVLPFGNLAFALGLSLLALISEPVLLFVAWIFMGIGASMGNYDSAFATAVSFLGTKANKVIAGITVFAGFSSTISWPLTSFLNDSFSWQTAVWFWVVMHLLVALPIHLSIPRIEPKEVADATGPIRKIIKNRFRFDPLLLVFAVMFALEGFIVSSVNSTLPFMLSEIGADQQVAIFAAAILGPSQVAARLLLVALDRYLTPMRVAAISILVHPAGVILLLMFGANAILPFVILHGIGVGLNPFIRGSLPLLFFGSESYGQRQGYVMMLSKIVSALSPTLLTLMLLANPQLAIVSTMSMGLAAMALLILLAFMRRTRQKVSLQISPTA
ncbi:MAG: MFS transporter [Aquiluna sp.]|nr:MFS transporter [Aquiluna sp.]